MRAKISYPEKATIEGLEEKWVSSWEESGIYRFDPSVPKDAIYSIDTPPPTVSGSLHIGHVLSYTHTDIIARFKRMSGLEVFYPMGWDDNGVPTERRVQNYFGVRCDPELPYDASFEPPQKLAERQLPISRRNFIELCDLLTKEDEKAFETLWRHLGLSVDWSMTYTTVGALAREISQRSFISLVKQNKVYPSEAPTLWDVDFQTAVAQAELEDRTTQGAYHRVYFLQEDGGRLEIETSRPELIAACIAIVAHPDDDRYKPLFGTVAYSPLFGVKLPILPHELAEPEKGTGAAMVATFGDLTDVLWWRELGLPVRAVIGRDGRLLDGIDFYGDLFASRDPQAATEAYGQLSGKSTTQARKIMAEMLGEAGLMNGEPKRIEHVVKYYEKGDRPLEVVTSRQWYIRTLEERERLIELGKELNWYPAFMRVRYDNWVNGLNSDWNISRQRFFGVPIPVWYALDPEGNPDFDTIILPVDTQLPVDPAIDTPPGYSETQRNLPGGFIADHDVMDTWATSSLSPQLAGGWSKNDQLFKKIFPMDLRPQGQDIIRTWLFYTVLRSELEHGELPWRNTSISGFVLDPDRKKMSKSKGNVVTPMPLLEAHGADALRYWAAGSRPGVDGVADEGQMKVGRRLAIKLANASRFVLSIASLDEVAVDDGIASITGLDLSFLALIERLVADATTAMDEYDYTKALEVTERAFWDFCDNYLELVKVRAYGNDGPSSSWGVISARATLATSLSIIQRLLAPFLPFVAEETWSWWQDGSIHRSPWPQIGETARLYQAYLARFSSTGVAVEAPSLQESTLYASASSLLSEIRKAKTEAKRSMKTSVERAVVTVSAAEAERLISAAEDIKAAGVVDNLEILIGGESSISISLKEA